MPLLALSTGFSICKEDKQTSSGRQEHGNLDKLLNTKSGGNKVKVKKQKLPKKKINRGKKKTKETELIIMSTNAAQLKGKLKSFKSELKRSNAGLFTVQETHCATKGKVEIENFEVFESIRNKVKGGTMSTRLLNHS